MKTNIAVFDFDGTLIPAQSGTRLSLKLIKDKQLSKWTAIRLLMWGIRYKAHLPYNEKIARELIFKAFNSQDANEVDKYIDKFYEDAIEDTVRTPLLDIAEQLRDEGVELVILSGAFYATLSSFAKRHDFLHVVGTKMEIDEEGNYTGKVEGECVAGKNKLHYLEEYCDVTFGKGKWEISYAFADHYTDKDLLNKAKNVYAVDPDVTLKRYAKKNGWNIIEFNKEKGK